MFEDLFWNWWYWKEYKHKLVMDKYIIQTSTKESLETPNIMIKNFIMSKKINGFIDFRPSYFNKHRATKNILLEQFDDMFGDYLIENDNYSIRGNYDILINDFSKDIFLKEVLKDLAIVEFDKKVALVYFGDINSIDLKELGKFVLYEGKGYNMIKFDVLRIYGLKDDLQAYFGLQHRATNPRRMLNRIIGLFERQQKIKKIGDEEEEFTALFSKNNLSVLKSYDFEKYIYFNEDFKLQKKDLINISSVGGTGSGKTFTLNLILLQIILSNDFKRIIYFDTQDSFENNIMYNVNPLYLARAKNVQNSFFKVTEKDFYLSEIDAVNSINFLLETKGYSTGESKQAVVMAEYDDWESFKEAVNIILDEQRNKLSINKDLNKIEDLEGIKRFMDIVKIKQSSFFEDLETQRKFFCIFSFQNTLFYEVSCYLYLQKLKDILYVRDEGYTYFFADETQKYLGSAFLKKVLLDLVKEKRQFGFRFCYTGLSHNDISDFARFTQHIIYNSFNDPYMLNTLKSMSNVPIESMKTPIEKIINDTQANSVKKTDLRLNLLNSVKGKKPIFVKGRERVKDIKSEDIEEKQIEEEKPQNSSSDLSSFVDDKSS